jgi:hypothetical protein
VHVHFLGWGLQHLEGLEYVVLGVRCDYLLTNYKRNLYKLYVGSGTDTCYISGLLNFEQVKWNLAMLIFSNKYVVKIIFINIYFGAENTWVSTAQQFIVLCRLRCVCNFVNVLNREHEFIILLVVFN